jgi:hypothetical protein
MEEYSAEYRWYTREQSLHSNWRNWPGNWSHVKIRSHGPRYILVKSLITMVYYNISNYSCHVRKKQTCFSFLFELY